MLVILLWVIAGIMLLSIFLSIIAIGRKRKPLSASTVAVATLINLLYIVVIVLAAIRLESL